MEIRGGEEADEDGDQAKLGESSWKFQKDLFHVILLMQFLSAQFTDCNSEWLTYNLNIEENM